MDLYLAYFCPGSESLHGWKGPKCNILLLLGVGGLGCKGLGCRVHGVYGKSVGFRV
jgi:hypothetical protein